MIQKQFQELAKDVLMRARGRLNSTYTPEFRMKVIKEMGAELEALRSAYGQLSGAEVEMPRFRELMQISD